MPHTIHVEGNAVVVVTPGSAAPGVTTTAQGRTQVEHRPRGPKPAEAAWARAHPALYREGGRAAFKSAEGRSTRVLGAWSAALTLVIVVATLWAVGLPDELLPALLALVVGSVLIAAIAAIPAVLLVAIPAMIHVALLDRRDEQAARRRADVDVRARALVSLTHENDRRLRALGIDA